MADPNRSKHLYANQRRLKQITDPSAVMTDYQKRQLPEDKTFMAA